mmetsp:Transcript_31567/g.75368  ORF Transcript_31567/g.75368 Transcript_31567/m.75368 type:complete len:222 (+) Transcript_31567:248-913(+)
MSTCLKGSQTLPSLSCGIPHPVSAISTMTSSSLMRREETVMAPLSVNLMELEMKLVTIWVMRLPSPSICGSTRSLSTSLVSDTPAPHSGASVSHTPSHTSRSDTNSCLSAKVPRRAEAESRMSLTRAARRLPQVLISCSVLTIWASHLGFCCSDSDSPMMPLSGVRSSCDTAARNSSSRARLSSSISACRCSFVVSNSLTVTASPPEIGFMHGVKVMRCHV